METLQKIFITFFVKMTQNSYRNIQPDIKYLNKCKDYKKIGANIDLITVNINLNRQLYAVNVQ